MLVLSRKKTERVLLPNIDTTIQVVDIQNNTVRLGFDAPAEISILREELELVDKKIRNKIYKENQELRILLDSIIIGLNLLGKQVNKSSLSEMKKTINHMLALLLPNKQHNMVIEGELSHLLSGSKGCDISHELPLD